MRNLENGRILENTYTAGEKIETISVERDLTNFFIKMIWASTSCIRRLSSRDFT